MNIWQATEAFFLDKPEMKVYLFVSLARNEANFEEC